MERIKFLGLLKIILIDKIVGGNFSPRLEEFWKNVHPCCWGEKLAGAEVAGEELVHVSFGKWCLFSEKCICKSKSWKLFASSWILFLYRFCDFVLKAEKTECWKHIYGLVSLSSLTNLGWNNLISAKIDSACKWFFSCKNEILTEKWSVSNFWGCSKLS